MAQSTQQFGIRLSLDGGQAVQAGLDAIAEAGQRAMQRISEGGAQASAALDRVTRSANDNAAGVNRLGQQFAGFEAQSKSVARAVGDAAGTLRLLGGAGSAADRALAVTRQTLGGVADAAGTAAAALGATGGGLAGALARLTGLIGVAVAAFQLVTLVTGRSAQTSREAERAKDDLAAAYRRLAQGAETAEERQARLRAETIRGIEADLDRVQSAERLNATLARTQLSEAQTRAANLQRQLLEEERVQAAAGERVTAVQRGRIEALREQVRALGGEIEAAAGRLVQAESASVRAAAQAREARINAEGGFGPPASAAPPRERAGRAIREDANALEEALNRIALAEGRVRLTNEQLAEARRLIEATATPAETYAATLDKLGELLAAGAIGQETFNRAVEQAKATLDRAEGSAQALARTGRELGLTFSSAFEEAVIQGKRLSEVLRGILQDIARIVLRRTVTEPLAGALSSAVGRLSFAGLFGGQQFGPPIPPGIPGFSALGNVFDRPGLVPFARGGVVSRPTLFGFAGGTGLMGEAGPEAILPLARDGQGRLGVRAETAAAGPLVSIAVDARGATDPAAIEAAAERGARRAVPYVLDAIRRGGQARQVVRG